jgi:hypothetical protein
MMNDLQLNNELDKLTHDATGNNTKFISDNAEYLKRYMGEPYGNELAERSKVISQDVQDVVESDMPSLARIFLGPTDIMKFKPTSAKEDDVKEAEDKTKYVNWQIRDQEWSFETLFGFIKNAEIQKVSVVKYYIEENTEVEEHKKTGLSDEELAIFEQSLEGEDVKSVEVVREEEGDEENTVVVKVEKTRKQVKIKNVELENFRMTKNVANKDEASLVGDVSIMTRGELLSEGYSKDQISDIPLVSTGAQENTQQMRYIRDKSEGTEEEATVDSWASEEVEVEDLYAVIDYDEDGIAECRRIRRGGDVILENEVFNHKPYALMNSIMMPHKAIGRSRAEVAAPTAEAKTAILRGVNDNIYAVNSPGSVANENVHGNDLLAPMRPNRVIRTHGKNPVGNDIMPIVVPYIGDKALQVIQYWDQARAQTTGSLLASQGLDADELGKETATRFQGVRDDSKGKVELVARCMAETGFRQLYEGIAWLDANFQDSETEIEVLGEELKVNPAEWKYNHKFKSKVGLGAGDDDEQIQTMTGLWTIHQQLQANQSPMTDEVKRFNVLKTLTKAAGLPEVEDYFNDPNRPDQLLQAENEIYKNMIMQLQVQLQQMQNPLAEAETIKQQGNLIAKQSDAQLNAAKLVEDQRQFNAKMMVDIKKQMEAMALQLTKLEVEAGRDLNAELEDNRESDG